MPHKILITEDDYSFGLMMQEWLKRKGFEAVLVQGIKQAKKEILQTHYSLVITDLRLPDGDGILLLTWIKELKKDLPVILMTNYADLQNAVLCIKSGAFDYLEKPINPLILEQKINQALAEPKSISNLPVSKKDCQQTGLIIEGSNPFAKEMYEQVMLVASTQLSVLIFGESGAGKEHIARLIHESSNRKNAPFIAVDCGSLLRELALSELFGHVKGAFTSAIADKKGVFELANGGTVFLDEIGNLPYDVQIQLLRTLQERQIHPVGSSKNVTIDVRILSATNENLEEAISNGRFRGDLYHRLNEFFIEVPALRDRLEDIPIFTTHFMKEANLELNKNVKSFSQEASKIISQYYWPGNLRELRNVVRTAVLYAQTDEIVPENLPALSTNFYRIETQKITEPIPAISEKESIESMLRKMKGNKVQTAKTLKISRKTLYNKIHLYGIDL